MPAPPHDDQVSIGRALGVACAFDEQCGSGRCSATGAACGTCVVHTTRGLGPGAPCRIQQMGEPPQPLCDDALFCRGGLTDHGTCAARIALSQPCTTADTCVGGAACVRGACVVATPAPRPFRIEGEACSRDAYLGRACAPDLECRRGHCAPSC
jgi:Dickkopf-like protein